jgi:hypothetical protein
MIIFHYMIMGHTLPQVAQYIVMPLDRIRGNMMKHLDE